MRCSGRLRWDSPPNALARLLDERRARSGAGPRFDLTESNPTRATLPYPDAAIVAALTAGLGPSLVYRPDPQGLPEAREAVADYYRSRGAAVDAADLLLCASTSEAYALLFKLLCDPGDVVLVPAPSYPLFDFLAALESVRLVPYPLAYDGEWHIDGAGLAQVIAGIAADASTRGRLRALVVVSPNNPTGSFLKRGERDRLVDLARLHDFALIADEVFADYALAPDPTGERVATLAAEREVLTFSLSGISKVLGLPQLKLGWIVVGGPEAERARALCRLELVADTYLSVGAPVQLAARGLFALRPAIHGAITARTTANLTALRGATRDTACEVLRAEGGWSAVVRVPATRTDEAWALALLEGDDVLVQPGYFYDFVRGAYLVVSLLAPEAIFDEGARRLVARVEAG